MKRHNRDMTEFYQIHLILAYFTENKMLIVGGEIKKTFNNYHKQFYHWQQSATEVLLTDQIQAWVYWCWPHGSKSSVSVLRLCAQILLSKSQSSPLKVDEFEIFRKMLDARYFQML